ncbi:hypothetical protein PHLH6_15700 [Pseudomonas sp. Seg1]|uniref:hypothetical protein n=1 Tax=Pseudomonas sp. Seg1 TaxID=2678259 RepID=UPI001BB39E4A|nr:hypothetical protein [Pseudomonas sp. Seg1]BBP69566.1 hypothetical protein PHLH6_15700 [Pseudomonas sp. Seg1]
MSYEYKLVFDDNFTAQHVMNEIKTSQACVLVKHGDIYLKDHALISNGGYHARLTQTDQSSLWLQINFQSVKLCGLLHKALSGISFRCLEDGDPAEEVGLNEAFRIEGHLV